MSRFENFALIFAILLISWGCSNMFQDELDFELKDRTDGKRGTVIMIPFIKGGSEKDYEQAAQDSSYEPPDEEFGHCYCPCSCEDYYQNYKSFSCDEQIQTVPNEVPLKF